MHIAALASNKTSKNISSGNTSPNKIKKTTNFGNAGVEFLSGLSNNSESLVPMMVKDVLSDGTLVYTYSKQGGKDDVREKAIEEFGTGIVWLYMIPGIKYLINKGIPFLNKTKNPLFKGIYHNLNLNPNFDPNLIISKNDIKNQIVKKAKTDRLPSPIKAIVKLFDDGINRSAQKSIQDSLLKNSTNPALADEKALFESLNKPNEALENFFKNHKLFNNFKAPTNAQMYKGLKIGKFIISTAAASIALIKLIEYKQKTTQKRIDRDFSKKNNASKVLINKNMNSDTLHQNFTSKIKNAKNNQLSFTGLDAFVTNPILNTLILDGVITSTRLAKARPGEKLEVTQKEVFQILFTYCLAIPIQKAFEKLGKAIKLPIALDPKVLWDKNLKDSLPVAAEKIGEFMDSEGKITSKNIIKDIYKLGETNPNHSLIKLLEQNGVLSTVEKNGKKAISYLNPLKEKDLKSAFKNIKELAKHSDNLNKIKAFKVFAVLGNILIAIGIMGVLQPMVTIWMRQLLSGGKKENLAINKLEQERQKSVNS